MSILKEQYTKLEGDREPILLRAIECAELTLPSLLTSKDSKEEDVLVTPFQSNGGRAVNNLASKLLLALLPPNEPFARFVADKQAMNELKETQPEVYEETKNRLSELEDVMVSIFEREGVRVNTFHMLKLLIATGNSLTFKQKDLGIKVFDLSQYVVRRDGNGKVLQIIVKEQIHKTSLPEDIQSQLEEADDEFKSYDIYTGIKLNSDNKYETTQEVEDIEIENSVGVYEADDTMPWRAMRYTAINNENYGRGLVEQYIGDLRSLEAISQAIVEAAAASAKILYMIDAMSTTRAKDVAKAKNGAIITGNANHVTTLQTQKSADLNVAYQTKNDIEVRLDAAFLMNSSAARKSERTTAYEVQYMATELEDALGGIYSILALEYQKPLMAATMKEQNIKLNEDLVKPIMVTGLDTFSKEKDFQKITTYTGTLQQMIGAEAFAEKVNIDLISNKIGQSLNLDTTGFIKTEEVLSQEQQAKMQTNADNTALQNAAAVSGQALAQDNVEEIKKGQ